MCLPEPFRIPHSAFRNAYTLLEMVIAVLILGILLAAGAPRYLESLDRSRVVMAARRIAADLNYARQDAEAKAASRSVQFTVGDDRYTLPNLVDLDHPDRQYAVDLSTAGYPVRVTAADFGGSATVAFNWYGQPTAAGSVTVQSGTEIRTVTVNSAGIVQVQP
jgi:prepilin-type N-terminal cleavage/methylation domain-containing protein